MAETAKRTMNDLRQMQALPLNAKIKLTEQRINEWADTFGVNNIVVSFSGGKDSTVLLDIARRLYPEVKALYVDTGLEYPELRDFVKTYNNVQWLKPKYNFREVIERFGYPFISKEISQCVCGARNCLNNVDSDGRRGEDNVKRLLGIGAYASTSTERDFLEFKAQVKHGSKNLQKMFGVLGDNGELVDDADERLREYFDKEAEKTGERARYNSEKYRFFLQEGAPPISNECCAVMKKNPIHEYQKETGYKSITAQMADESFLRTQQWIRNGCNAFDLKNPISNPMAFWTEQDVLEYIYTNGLPICPVYGEVVKGDRFATTGCDRTGCIFCAYGIHLDKGENRFGKLSVTHPNLYDYVMRGGEFNEEGEWHPTRDGLGYWYCIEWINLHGGFKIKYPNRDYYLKKYMTDETAKYLKGIKCDF